jgi:hypothetical protein
MYAFGLFLDRTLISTENPNCEIASSRFTEPANAVRFDILMGSFGQVFYNGDHSFRIIGACRYDLMKLFADRVIGRPIIHYQSFDPEPVLG